jgi:hypothetical protein
MPTRAGKPRDKGKVEKAVQDVERWVLAPLRNVDFCSLAEINREMWKLLGVLNSKQMQTICSRNLKNKPYAPYQSSPSISPNGSTQEFTWTITLKLISTGTLSPLSSCTGKFKSKPLSG